MVGRCCDATHKIWGPLKSQKSVEMKESWAQNFWTSLAMRTAFSSGRREAGRAYLGKVSDTQSAIVQPILRPT